MRRVVVLPAPLSPRETDDLAFLNAEGQAAYGSFASVVLGQVLYFNHRASLRYPLSKEPRKNLLLNPQRAATVALPCQKGNPVRVLFRKHTQAGRHFQLALWQAYCC